MSYLDYLFSKVVFLTIPSNPANQHLPLKSTFPSSLCGLGIWNINPMIEWMLEGAPLNLLGRDEEGGQRCGWEGGGLRWTERGSWSQGGRNKSRSEKKIPPQVGQHLPRTSNPPHYPSFLGADLPGAKNKDTLQWVPKGAFRNTLCFRVLQTYFANNRGLTLTGSQVGLCVYGLSR